jgi:hypothetical protein
LYGLAAFVVPFILAVLWIIESLEPERKKSFDLKITSPDPVKIRGDVEAILRGAGTTFELRSAGAKDLAYEVELPYKLRTDRLANAILRLEEGNDTEVSWEEKIKK